MPLTHIDEDRVSCAAIHDHNGAYRDMNNCIVEDIFQVPWVLIWEMHWEILLDMCLTPVVCIKVLFWI